MFLLQPHKSIHLLPVIVLALPVFQAAIASATTTVFIEVLVGSDRQVVSTRSTHGQSRTSHVFRSGYRLQVIRADALDVSAQVIKLKPIRDNPHDFLVHKAVNAPVMETGVTSRGASGPVPASIRLINAQLNPIHQIRHRSHTLPRLGVDHGTQQRSAKPAQPRPGRSGRHRLRRIEPMGRRLQRGLPAHRQCHLVP